MTVAISFELEEVPVKTVIGTIIALLCIVPAGALAFQDDTNANPCQISATRAENIAMRTGPGFDRSILAFLRDGVYTVLNEAEADDGSRWYQLDKDQTLSADQAEVVLEVWIPARRVRLTGNCADVTIPLTIAQVESCTAVVAAGARVPVRNAPGIDTRIIRRLPEGEYGILNQTTIRDNIWYEINPADSLPNQENPRVQTWVSGLRITTDGACEVSPAPEATEEPTPSDS